MRQANHPWKIEQPKNGRHVVRERSSNAVIGTIIPYRGSKGEIGYHATRETDLPRSEPPQVRSFQLRWDAAYWLMQGFDSRSEAQKIDDALRFGGPDPSPVSKHIEPRDVK